MPPLLMVSLFSMFLNLVAPEARIDLPHVANVDRLAVAITENVRG